MAWATVGALLDIVVHLRQALATTATPDALGRQQIAHDGFSPDDLEAGAFVFAQDGAQHVRHRPVRQRCHDRRASWRWRHRPIRVLRRLRPWHLTD